MNRRDFLKKAVIAGAGILAARGRSIRSILAQALPSQLRRMPVGFDMAAARRTLGAHKIAKTTIRTLTDVFLHDVGPNSRGNPAGGSSSERLLVITTDQGISGWSSSGGSKEADFPKLIGKTVRELFDVSSGLASGLPFWLDRPLHDLAGMILGRPVYEVLGGAGLEEVLLYDGSIYFEDLTPKDAPRGVQGLIRICRAEYQAGYRAFKLKIGRGFKWMPKADGLKRDIEVTRAVREDFKDCKLLVDANDAYTVQEAIEYIKAVADCDLYWIEEPFEENADDLRRLREAMDKAGCKARIADGESQGRTFTEKSGKYGAYADKFVERLYSLGRQKLVDISVMDLDSLGFSRWWRVMPEMLQAGLQASPHNWRWSLRAYYTAQLAFGVGNIPIIEAIPSRTKGLDASAYGFKDGKLRRPKAPGFGLALT